MEPCKLHLRKSRGAIKIYATKKLVCAVSSLERLRCSSPPAVDVVDARVVNGSQHRSKDADGEVVLQVGGVVV